MPSTRTTFQCRALLRDKCGAILRLLALGVYEEEDRSSTLQASQTPAWSRVSLLLLLLLILLPYLSKCFPIRIPKERRRRLWEGRLCNMCCSSSRETFTVPDGYFTSITWDMIYQACGPPSISLDKALIAPCARYLESSLERMRNLHTLSVSSPITQHAQGF